MPNFINMYFGLCLVAWVIDIVALAAIVVIKPLRKWCWKKYCKLVQEFSEIYLSVFDD